jgi:hypothetical protein
VQLQRNLTEDNVDDALETYVRSVEAVGDCIRGLSGIQLLETLKRGKVGCGPYPSVSLFEAANRIMTDLVILYGVRWLLRNKAFPFRSYTVEYGHENNNAHDLKAEQAGRILIGEAFNVAPSFFSTKKTAAIQKLRASTIRANYLVILCNDRAVLDTYLPKPREIEHFVFVTIGGDVGRVVPNRPLQPTSGATGGDGSQQS